MVTFLFCIDSSLRPRSTTPYWPQGIKSPFLFFFFSPTHHPQHPGRSPAGRSLGHTPARPAGGSSERPRPPRCQAVSPHHGWRALRFRLARPGIPGPGRPAGSMSRSQGPGQGPLAPKAGQEVGPGAGRCSGGRAGTFCPRPCLPVVHTPFGLRSLPAGITRGAREPALPAPLLLGVRVPGSGDGAPESSSPAPPPCSPARLVHSPSRPAAPAQTERGQQGESAPEDTQLVLPCLFTPR